MFSETDQTPLSAVRVIIDLLCGLVLSNFNTIVLVTASWTIDGDNEKSERSLLASEVC